MTTGQGQPAQQPDTRTKAEQVRRITERLEARLAGPSNAVRIIRTISTLTRKNG